jgi:hypothetical protein
MVPQAQYRIQGTHREMNKDLGAMNLTVTALFDEATNTVTYIVADPATAKAAIVDCVLDFNPKSARTSTPFGGPADRSRAAAGPGGGVGSGDARPRRPSIGRPLPSAAENWRRQAIHPRKDTDRTMSETRGPDRAFQKARAPAVSLR